MADIDIGSNLYQIALVALIIVAIGICLFFNQPGDMIIQVIGALAGIGGAGALALAESIKKKPDQ